MKVIKYIFLNFTILIYLFLTASCQDQQNNFEGIIKYEIKYQSTSNKYSEEFMKSYFGDTAIVFIKSGQYKYVYPNARGFYESFYQNRSNNYYLLKPGIDTLFYANVGFSNEKFAFEDIERADSLILGWKCKSALLVSNSCRASYYYAPELPLSSKPFKRHKFGGYDVLTKNIKSIYLAKIEEFDGYKIITKAYSVKRENLPDSIFDLPILPLKHF
jgi:hypothetical protein